MYICKFTSRSVNLLQMVKMIDLNFQLQITKTATSKMTRPKLISPEQTFSSVVKALKTMTKSLKNSSKLARKRRKETKVGRKKQLMKIFHHLIMMPLKLQRLRIGPMLALSVLFLLV